MKILLPVVMALIFPLATTSRAHEGIPIQSEARAAKKTIKPGDPCWDNGDVVVCNTGTGNRTITVDPGAGSATSATTVTFNNNSQGTVTGVDANDSVDVRSSAQATITGTGGTVRMEATGARAAITNEAGQGSTDMTIILHAGASVTLPPGSSVIVQT